MSLYKLNVSNRAFLEAYEAPYWTVGLKGVPTHRVKLAQCNTPIQRWNLLGLPDGFEVYIKREDMTGSVLSGNKVRSLEFVFADAIQQGCTSVITCGHVASNFLRATAISARSLGMQAHLLIRTDKIKDSISLPCQGNSLLYRMVGAPVYLIPLNSRIQEDVCPRMRQLADKIRKTTGEKAYVMYPYSTPWVFGYVDVFHEMMKQGISSFTDIVLASAGGVTSAGLIVGNHMTGNKYKIHGMATKCQSSSEHNVINEILKDIGLQKPDGTGLRSEDAYNPVDEAIGAGYDISSPDELDFITNVAAQTGIILDPVYSGKAAYYLVKQLNSNPGRFKGKKILFIHTGGMFNLFDGRMQDVLDKKPDDGKVCVWDKLTDDAPFTL